MHSRPGMSFRSLVLLGASRSVNRELAFIPRRSRGESDAFGRPAMVLTRPTKGPLKSRELQFRGTNGRGNVYLSNGHLMTQRNTKNVSLTPELERFVADRVASGRYRSASEVVRAALRLLEKEERATHAEPPPANLLSRAHDG